jgi:hypothetical protein
MDVAASGERVLLLDEGWSATLHLARAFEVAGYRVTVATANGGRARYRRRGVAWLEVPTLGSPALAGELDRIACDRLLPLTERAIVWAAERANAFPAIAAWQRPLVADKHALLGHVAARGIAVPRSVPLADARAAIAELGLPLVVKGATGAGGARVWIATTRAELDAAVARARAIDDRWIVQEYIPGPTYLVAGVFDAGRPLRVYAAEKLEQYPPRTGPAIRLRSRADRALVAAGLDAIRALAWTGFASADLVRTAHGYALLEINPRLWGSVAAALAAGVDVLAAFVELVAGRIPEPELHFPDNREHAIFPRNALAHPGEALRALAGPQGRDWRHPGFLRFLLGRALRYGLITRRPTVTR